MKKHATEKTELEKKLEAELEESPQAPDGEAPPIEEPPAAPDPAAIAAERDAALAERDALKDQLLRTRAEFDNYRRRTARDNERIRKTAAEAVIGDLLPVVDNLERALEHVEDASGGLAEGVTMVLKQLCDVLARHGLEPIPAQGESFDPNVHEAVLQTVSDSVPAGHVIQEFQRGYRLGGFVLRPAKVVVSAGRAEEEAVDQE